MNFFISSIRNGSWLTIERIRNYSLIILAISVVMVVATIVTSSNLVDAQVRPLGTDFSSFYAAGSLVLEGKAAAVYDMAAHYAREQALFGARTPFYTWLYPPLFLLVVTPLALIPYPYALAAWQGLSLLLYLLVVSLVLAGARKSKAITASNWLLPATAFPAILLNLTHGQNGLLSAALIGGALAALPRRPIIAGVLFGLLAYKPQFALVIPIALVAGGYWRTIASAAATVSITVAASILLFGWAPWHGFLESAPAARKLLLEDGDVGFEKLQSAFAAIRLMGGDISLAYGVQGIVSLAVIASIAWFWRAPLDHARKSALLITATLLASPHVLDYDLTILGPAMAFSVSAGLARGFRNFEITMLAVAWATPLLARTVAGQVGMPLGFVVLGTLYVLFIRHAAAEARSARLLPQPSA